MQLVVKLAWQDNAAGAGGDEEGLYDSLRGGRGQVWVTLAVCADSFSSSGRMMLVHCRLAAGVHEEGLCSCLQGVCKGMLW